MPYIKEISPGVFNSYQVQRVDIGTSEIDITLSYIDNSSGTPRQSIVSATIRNENDKILDPEWTESSTPPKPAGFNLEDSSTWGGIDPSDIPMIPNPETQFFNSLVMMNPSGGNIYEKIKNASYEILQQTGDIPPKSDGWVVA